jgi:hypothetical protein
MFFVKTLRTGVRAAYEAAISNADVAYELITTEQQHTIIGASDRANGLIGFHCIHHRPPAATRFASREVVPIRWTGIRVS